MVLISCYISPKTSLKGFSSILMKMEANIKSLDKKKQFCVETLTPTRWHGDLGIRHVKETG